VNQFTHRGQNSGENADASIAINPRPAFRPSKAGQGCRNKKGGFMDHPICKHTAAISGEMTAPHSRPLDRARAISGMISEEALASERLGRLTDKVAAALLDANLFSIRLPPADGGLGGTGVEVFEAAEEISHADGSAGWNVAISNAVNTFVHKGAPAKAREEVFGNGPVACWATLLPKAISVEEQGGYRVSGNFAWGSSSSLSRWVLVPARLTDRDGQQWFRGHVLPKEDVEIKEGSWDVMGLRGTASIDYSIDNKFVPAHRAFEYPFLADRNPQNASAQGLIQLGQPGLVAFASGIGFRALDELIAAAPKTKRLLAEGTQADDNVVQFGIGELEGRLRAARTHYLNLVARQDEAIAEGRALGPAGALDMQQAGQILARAARDMTVFAFDNAGTTVVFATNPLQRCLRDIFTGLKHGIMTPAILGRIGKVRLGLDYGAVGF
jgi:alkylation response protein AidB-like acyl-CoA dehydrogenase